MPALESMYIGLVLHNGLVRPLLSRHIDSMTNCHVPDNLGLMVREISSGGVVVRFVAKNWQLAVIEPQKETPGATSVTSGRKKAQKMLLALPKGLVDPGEKPEQTAIREVKEETGLDARPITKLGDIKYMYVRSWGDKERVFKIVSFYLLEYESGTIDDIAADMRIEVQRALWIPLENASRQLAYSGEKDMVRRAIAYLRDHPELSE
jgi:8-oxo-dGTP pyrophosphatase MutT (NUDIX family)